MGMARILQFARHLKRAGNITALRTLVAAAQKQHVDTTSLCVVHAVSGANVDTHLRNTLPDRLHIAGIAVHQTAKADLNPRTRPEISEVVEPIGKFGGFAQFEHAESVAYWIQNINPDSSSLP